MRGSAREAAQARRGTGWLAHGIPYGMEQIAYVSAALAAAVAENLSDEDLGLLAALLTAVADQLALIAVCRERSRGESPAPDVQEGD